MLKVAAGNGTAGPGACITCSGRSGKRSARSAADNGETQLKTPRPSGIA